MCIRPRSSPSDSPSPLALRKRRRTSYQATSALFIGVALAEDGTSVSWPVGAVTVVILVGVNVLPALLLHLWAKRLEKSVTSDGAAEASPVEPAAWPRPTGHPVQPPPA